MSLYMPPPTPTTIDLCHEAEVRCSGGIVVYFQFYFYFIRPFFRLLAAIRMSVPGLLQAYSIVIQGDIPFTFLKGIYSKIYSHRGKKWKSKGQE